MIDVLFGLIDAAPVEGRHMCCAPNTEPLPSWCVQVCASMCVCV